MSMSRSEIVVGVEMLLKYPDFHSPICANLNIEFSVAVKKRYDDDDDDDDKDDDNDDDENDDDIIF